MSSWIAVSGFGPFVGVDHNPSGDVALALAAAPPPGVTARATVLPVSLVEAPRALDRWIASQESAPAAILSLGVQREASFRLERRARLRLDSRKRDNDERLGAGFVCEGEGDLETALELEALARVLSDAGAPAVRVSGDAGGFVCERIFHHCLRRSAAAGSPALFLHVPPATAVRVEEQVPVVRALLAALWERTVR